MSLRYDSFRVRGRTAQALVALLLLSMGVSVTYAQYTSTSDVTLGSSTSLATVTSSAASFSVVEGETATKSLGTVFTVSSIDAAYDNKVRLNLYLLNPDTLKTYYSFFLVNVKVQQNGASADGSTWQDVTGASGYINLDAALIEFMPGIDFNAAPNNVNPTPAYRIVATVTYHNVETTGLVAPSFYLDVQQ